MAFHPKTGAQQFDSSWQKAVAWAQSNGISPSSYLPVYQLDLTRIQNGEYPMGAAERNLSIMAAHNPNVVTSNPADHPASPFTPSGAFHNAVSDVGKIATGLAGIFTGSFEKQVWHSAQATFKGIVDPASLAGHGIGGTIGNWLNDTLLAYLPGAADIGTVLQHDPTLSGSSGFTALAQHPVVSFLDILPGGGGLLERLAGKVGASDIAASLAARGGNKSFFAEAARTIGGKRLPGSLNKTGVNLQGVFKQLSIADHIQLLAARGGRGVGPALSRLGNALQETSSMTADMYTWLLDGPTQMARNLSPEEMTFIRKVLDTRRTTGGDSVREALAPGSGVSPAVKDFIKAWLNGPLRFAKEEEMFAGGIRPTESLNGDIGWWSTSGVRSRRVLKAQLAMRSAEHAAINTVMALAGHVDRVEHLDEMLAQSTTIFQKDLRGARQTVFSDEKLQRPLTQELTTHKTGVLQRVKEGPGRARGARSLNRLDQVHAVVGEGGLADQFLKAIESGDPVLIGELAKAMRERLSAWGPKSIDAAEHPALVLLRQRAVAFERWAKERQKESKSIHDSVYGEIARQEHQLQERARYRSEGLAKLKEQHKRERAELDEGYRMAKSQRMGKLAAKTAELRKLQLQYTDSIEKQGDIVAARATRHVLDTQIMPEVRRKIYAFNQYTAGAIKEAKKKYLADNKEAWKDKQIASLKMVKRHSEQMTKAKKVIAGELEGMGDDLRTVRSYGKAIQGFHDAVRDNPSDAYRDVYVELLQKHSARARAHLRPHDDYGQAPARHPRNDREEARATSVGPPGDLRPVPHALP